jgi:acetyl-CoA carboxylase biotin carboxyl carrier protein
MDLSHADVEEILQLLENSPYDELRLETDRFKLTLIRGNTVRGGWYSETCTMSEPDVIAGDGSVSIPLAATTPAADQQAPASEDGDDGFVLIPAPLIGTFYSAPQPGAPPFVELGSRVEEHTVIAIIEVMKLMNSVSAGVCGEIVEICVQDGEFVEAGHPLMRVRPDEV